MFEGIYYVMRTGCGWRDLPGTFGPWSSVYTRFRRWSHSGLWERLLAELSRHSVGKTRSVDCSYVKVHRDGANPAGGQRAQAMGRTKGGLNSKIAAMVDALGRAIALRIAPGNQCDLHACEPLFDALRGQWVLADRAFDSDALRRKLAHANCLICIPPRAKRTIQYYYHKPLYRLRHTVENFFARIKFHHRIASRHDKLALTYLAFVSIAAVCDWIRFEV